jgi:DNA-binding NarL/FixJ family response regulator
VKSRLYSEALSLALSDTDDVEVIGTVTDVIAAPSAVAAREPDLVLFDMNVDEAERMLRGVVQAAASSKVVAVGVNDRDDSVIGCLEAGAVGYLPTHSSLSELRDCILTTSRGEMSCSPRIAARLARRVASLAAEVRRDQPPRGLTARETQILELIVQGLSNKEIAGRLCIEVPTVKHHVHNILEKLQVTRRGEAAARARRELPAPRVAVLKDQSTSVHGA